jgi:hypothetical protein
MNDLQSPKHASVKSFLRIAGPLLVLVGLLFTVIGMVSFFSSFGSFQSPHYFWCCFVGMPLLFIGLIFSKFGYLGGVLRYLAAESAPVAKDSVNYLAEGTKDALKTVTRAVAEGVQEAQDAHRPK